MLRTTLYTLRVVLLACALVAPVTLVGAAELHAPVAQEDGGGEDGGGEDGGTTLPETGASDYLSTVLLAVGVLVLAGGLVVRHRVA